MYLFEDKNTFDEDLELGSVQVSFEDPGDKGWNHVSSGEFR